ncbi:xanthine dehydrogenase family protein molybdopterin-binding subunit [Metallosphaera tengchongensis]|uniref:Xanthine dehydrogenase family protein molybdopterin-binding subunit n=1 Tax=Metallosphaera tengchongensis TaxID=1532350 RepID=A0A6N0NV59_9CREN|nr:xanthine dehydrogenase family protein molybdopterin-binding subunit [Metallosphaera tengchongensis]QKR00075.1 xanthine dehydrogenase family protein molybdopterin-binding subunit [Metallosphaera tengchongensis]
MIGKPMRRVEDPRLLTGRGRFIDDISLPGELFLGVVRSPYPRARFKVHTTNVDGAQVITQNDLRTNPLPCFFFNEAPKEYPLAVNEARYVGEPVALVVGRDRYEVEDLKERVDVEYEPLTAVESFQDALSGGNFVHSDLGKNLVYEDVFEYGKFPTSYRTVEKSFRVNRISPMPMETNGVIADYSPGDGSLTVYANTQVPQIFRTALSIVFQIPRSRIRIIVPDSGGGFGGKIFLKPLVLATLASILTERPVKYVETRTEHVTSAVQGPDREYRARIMFRDSEILGMDVDLLENFGAYMHTYQPLPVLRQIYHLAGAYDLKYLRFRVRGVLTNMPPTGPYRGLGIPPAVLVLENMVSSVSRVIGIDQWEVRKRNFIRSLPFTSISGAIYDSGDYEKSLETLRNALGDKGPGLEGLGVAFALEPGSSLAFQTLVVGKPRTPYYEGVYIKMDSGGDVTVQISTNSMGTGHETSVVQVVSHELGISPEKVRVIMGDTAGPPGTGFYGSRFSVVTISAVYKATLKLKEKMRRLLSQALNVEMDKIEMRDGAVRIGQKSVTLEEAANIIYNRYHSPIDDIGLEATEVFNSPNVNVADEKRRVNFSSTYGVNAHGAILKIDPETGFVKIKKYVIVSDSGTIINPVIVDGQLMGGTAMGIGAALYEIIKYVSGTPLQSNLGDYWMPTAMEVPKMEIRHLVSPSPFTPLGTKGVAEGGATVPYAVIANALEDALGVNLERIEVPITPEFVQGLLRERLKVSVG